MWSDPVPNDSSPQIDNLPASIKFPKNFHPNSKKTRQSVIYTPPHTHSPVGTSKHSTPFCFATKSIALLVGILLANPFNPFSSWKYGITSAQSAIIATESDGVTNASFP